ncbi:MBL fold metallo-hydrolase, partial [Eubacterium sp.]
MSNAIHFLNTGAGDCIILESNNHFAMIDCAEDTEYPADKPHLKAKGYENEILDYLLKNCADENGKVNLDFVLGTHAHSDHIGGFDTIISDARINVGKAYLKPYDDKDTFIYERVR